MTGSKLPRDSQPHDYRWRIAEQDRNCAIHPRPYEVVLAASSKPTHMVVANESSGCVFVKEYNFFVSQGGQTQKWGKHWRPVWADGPDDMEGARKQGCEMFTCAKPYEKQAK